METRFKPASPHILSEIRDKKKRKENFITGEVIESVEKKEQLTNIRGDYCLEFFDKGGKLVEKIEAENATPLLYSRLGTTRQLSDLGILSKTSNYIWGDFSYPRFFDEGFIFFTQENNLQTESIRGAIPSGNLIGMSVLDQTYTGESNFAGSVNQSLCTVEAGHNVTTMTYAVDFTLERGNGTFDTVWLGHHTSNRYEQGFNEMKFKVGGSFKPVDNLSPAFSSINQDLSFSKNDSYPDFFPLDGYTYFGHNFDDDSNSDMQGYFIYDSTPGSNEVTLQRVEVLNNEFNSCEAGGAAVYKGKPAVMKRKPVSTNLYEFLSFDLIKDVSFQLTNPQSVKLSTASLPNHPDLRLIHIKSFENALYAIFKPFEAEWGKDAVIYCVKYSNDGTTYYGHTTFNFDAGSTGVSQDKFKTQSAVDVYRINDVDYFVIAYEHNLNNQYATPYYCALTNENKVVDRSKLNAFSNAPGANSSIWRQLEPNGLFFSQTHSRGSNCGLKLMALMAPFSHTKINTTVKDSSQSMRLTYTVKIYHNIAEQYLPPKKSLEENLLLSEDQEENISIFSKFKSVFSTK